MADLNIVDMAIAKQMILFCYGSYADFWRIDQKKIKADYQNLLKDLSRYNSALKDMSIVWGPVIHKSPLFTTDALAFIAKDPSGGYYVVIRGTNPISAWSWLVDDFLTFQQLPWAMTTNMEHITQEQIIGTKGTASVDIKKLISIFSGSNSFEDKCAVSLSAFLSLWVHVNLRDEYGQTIRDFLIAKKGDVKKLYITGHSLGGLLAPTYGLWLYENTVELQHTPTDIYAFAGPTAGNSFFAQYTDSLFCLNRTVWNYYRLYNHYDVVVNVWNKTSMDSIKYLYQSAGITPDDWECGLINTFLFDAYGKDYTQPGMAIPLNSTLDNPVTLTNKDFLLQMGYQHVFPYLFGCGYNVIQTLSILFDIIFKIPFSDKSYKNLTNVLSGEVIGNLQQTWKDTSEHYTKFCKQNNRNPYIIADSDVDTFFKRLSVEDAQLSDKFKNSYLGLIKAIGSMIMSNKQKTTN